MKKFFRLFLFTFLFTLTLTGCREEKVFKIGVSQCSSDDWRTKMNEEINLEAMLHDDIEVEIRSANDDSKKQIEDIKYFIENDFDIIIVAPNEAKSLTPVIEEVYDSGIPVIIFDRNINSEKYTERIGVDNIGIGINAALYANHIIPDSLRVMEIYGLPGSSPAEDRHEGFLKGLDETKGRIVMSAPANWHEEEAITVVDSMLKETPDINLIFAHNDRMAIGASKVLERNGRKDIKIIGIDAAPNIGIKAVADSVIDATFLYPTEGHLVLREAIKILRGEPYSKEKILPMASAVDKSNADILLLQNQTIDEDTRKINELKGRLDDYWEKHSAQTSLFYAIIAILILLFGVLFLVLRMFWENRRHQETLTEQNRLLEEERDKQKELNEKLEEATQSKLVFFTNVSHDLRTPLTLISEPVAQLKEASNLTDSQSRMVRIADKNVKILNRLINQILDFRKYENQRMEIKLTEINFSHAIREWTDAFLSVAAKRNIKIIIEEPEKDKKELKIAIDVEKIERVYFNLLSNALKYSPDNSKITISYFEEEDNLIFKVADTGRGISNRDIGHIFDRFFQVDRVRPQGSGIGLSLAKAFIELHGGTIDVESEPGVGSVFTVKLPLRHVEEEETVFESHIDRRDVEAELLDEGEPEKEFSDDKPLLLIIDDNQDIRQMVSQIMENDYNILTAPDGKEGIRKAMKYVPDLIICDVMMPGIDGLETCTRLKEETATSHIPVLMLTACSMDEQRVEGFESGADGYLSKPFSSEVLKAQAKSLINNRKRISGIDRINGSHNNTDDKKPSSSERVSINGRESDFYNRFLAIFEKQMGNPELSVETLASEMGLERTQFYRKIKSITNYSPVELMRRIRLQKARTMISSTEKSISEIGYEVGFSTPAYFTKCYREAFGETPSETRGSLA